MKKKVKGIFGSSPYLPQPFGPLNEREQYQNNMQNMHNQVNTIHAERNRLAQELENERQKARSIPYAHPINTHPIRIIHYDDPYGINRLRDEYYNRRREDSAPVKKHKSSSKKSKSKKAKSIKKSKKSKSKSKKK